MKFFSDKALERPKMKKIPKPGIHFQRKILGFFNCTYSHGCLEFYDFRITQPAERAVNRLNLN